jgi:hypothetical protein
MNDFLVGAAVFVLAMVALGLLRIFWGPAEAERISSAAAELQRCSFLPWLRKRRRSSTLH